MFAVPAMALALYALEAKKEKLFWLAIALTLLVREDMGIYVASIGLYVWRCENAPFGKGRCWSSWARRGSWQFQRMCFPISPGRRIRIQTCLENLAARSAKSDYLARNPLLLLARWFEPDKLAALWRLLFPMAFLPLLAPGEQILWVPGVLALLTTSEQEINTLGGWWVRRFCR